MYLFLLFIIFEMTLFRNGCTLLSFGCRTYSAFGFSINIDFNIISMTILQQRFENYPNHVGLS